MRRAGIQGLGVQLSPHPALSPEGEGDLLCHTPHPAVSRRERELLESVLLIKFVRLFDQPVSVYDAGFAGEFFADDGGEVAGFA